MEQGGKSDKSTGSMNKPFGYSLISSFVRELLKVLISPKWTRESQPKMRKFHMELFRYIQRNYYNREARSQGEINN